jgi:hypothetical protein
MDNKRDIGTRLRKKASSSHTLTVFEEKKGYPPFDMLLFETTPAAARIPGHVATRTIFKGA